MSILQVKSQNPDLSYIISKNPNSGILAKSLRKGVVIGYYSKGDNQSYNIFFKDGSDEVSFPSYEGEEYEYLNVTRYNSAYFVVSAIEEVLRSAFKSNEFTTPDGPKTDEGGFESSFFINMIHIKNDRYIDAFNDYFPDYNVEFKLVNHKNYQITITTKRSLFELINFVSLFAIFNVIVNEEPIHLQDENIVKYIKCMNVIDAPYFLRYLFKIRFIKGKNLFLRNIDGFGVVCEELSKNTKKSIQMTFGDTWQARQFSIEERLDFNRNIMDLGCGEGRYIVRFNRYMKDNQYFAIDIDDEVRSLAERKVKNKDLKNVNFFSNLDDFSDSVFADEPLDIICTEVIEHMSEEEAHDLIKKAMSLPNVNSIIITTPDVRFNVNYFMTGFRHHGHVFEWDNIQFQKFVSNCLGSIDKNYDSQWFPIGDFVDGITPSQGIIIKFK